jgi:putative ATPase
MSEATDFRPLAERMRPRRPDQFYGQQDLLGVGKPLRRALEAARVPSMVLWGPPGSGKTSIARLAAHACSGEFLTLSATLAGVKEIRSAIERARSGLAMGRRTVLFIDEAHRFNKAQQDAFLPFVEDGTVTFVGATTENPSFELNAALISRLHVYVLKPLGVEAIRRIIDEALADPVRGLGQMRVTMDEALRELLAQAADGDARRALNALQLCCELATNSDRSGQVTHELLSDVLRGATRRFDKGGDVFYDQISALHKSVRGSHPDAALYWLCRMLDGGCDPEYLARRLVRIASEDIGNADPRALRLALDAWDSYNRLGSPEGELALAQATLYLASAPKSNAAYRAFNAAMSDVRAAGSLEVPMHLRNAPTSLMKRLGHGRDYRYAHDAPEGYVAGECYFPEQLCERRYYQPSPRGLELKIGERLGRLRQADAAHRAARK